ncbi:hypothetical protein [Fodinicurvata halophila]|uniref:hypothetical protein n=1 Tax=Fodinicurvata halophila TaxID=1419723 RepID=UPI003640E060
MSLLRFLVLAFTLFPAGVLMAQEVCEPTRPVQQPSCSTDAMLAAIDPQHTIDVLGNINPEAFVGGANAALAPGQANLSISGGVSAGGVACAKHLGARRIGGSDGVPGLSEGMASFLEDKIGRDVPTASGGRRQAVFEIFSPNIIVFESGALGDVLSLRHGGIGGWPSNSGAFLRITLTDAAPGDLQAGGPMTPGQPDSMAMARRGTSIRPGAAAPSRIPIPTPTLQNRPGSRKRKSRPAGMHAGRSFGPWRHPPCRCTFMMDVKSRHWTVISRGRPKPAPAHGFGAVS